MNAAIRKLRKAPLQRGARVLLASDPQQRGTVLWLHWCRKPRGWQYGVEWDNRDMGQRTHNAPDLIEFDDKDEEREAARERTAARRLSRAVQRRAVKQAADVEAPPVVLTAPTPAARHSANGKDSAKTNRQRERRQAKLAAMTPEEREAMRARDRAYKAASIARIKARKAAAQAAPSN